MMTTPFSILKLSAASLVFFSLALPSGNFAGIPFKYVAYSSCLLFFVFGWIRGSYTVDRRLISLFVAVSAFVAFYILLGSIESATPFGFVLMEGVGVFSAITIVIILMAIRAAGAVREEDLILYAFYGAFVFAIWKVAVVLLLVSGAVSYPDVYLFFIQYVGYRPVTSGIYGGLVRFNLIIYDFVVAFFLFLVPAFPRIFKRVPLYFRVAFVFVGLACLVFAFSRLLFGIVALLWCYVFVFKAATIRKIVIGLIVAATVVVASPWLSGVLEQRYQAAGSSRSDEIRVNQISALLDTWSHAPLIGGGFGYYSKSLIRDPSVPFSYEVQWVGFLAKLGILGVTFLLGLVGLLFFVILGVGRTPDHFVLAFVLAAFVLGGFTNQYLVSSASGIFYTVQLIVSAMLRRRADCERPIESAEGGR